MQSGVSLRLSRGKLPSEIPTDFTASRTGNALVVVIGEFLNGMVTASFSLKQIDRKGDKYLFFC